MRDIEQDDVVEIAAQMKCTVCGVPYGRHGVDVLGRRNDSWIIEVSCLQCGTEGLMIATVEEETDSDSLNVEYDTNDRPKIMYDVTYDEWLAFNRRPAVSYDDVLDVHKFLKTFDGDFENLFRHDMKPEDH